MRDRVFGSLIVGALVCSAGSGDVAYAFGTSVVPGLDRTDPVTAVTAMGGIITEARSNPAFVLLLAATAVLALVVGVLAARRLHQPGGTTLLAGAGFTLLAGSSRWCGTQCDVSPAWRARRFLPSACGG